MIIKRKFIYKLIVMLFICLQSPYTLSAFQSKKLDSVRILKRIDSAITSIKVSPRKAKDLFDQARKMLDKTNIPHLEARMYIGLGTLARIQGSPVKSLEFRLKSLELHEQLGDSLGISINYHNIAVILRDQKKYGQAEDYLKKAIEIKKNLEDVRELAQSYNVLGMIYRRQKKYQSAERNYQLAHDLVTSVGDVAMQMNVKGNLATLYSVQKRYEESIAINKLAIPYYDSLKKLTSLASRYYNIGYSYYKLKEYDSAHMYVDKAIAIAQKEKLKVNIINYHYRKSRIFQKQEQYKKALKAYRMYKKIYDSIYNIRNAEKMKEILLKSKFKSQQRLDSIAFAESEKRLTLQAHAQQQRKNLFLGLLIIAMFAIFIGHYAFMIKRKLLSTKLQTINLQKTLLNERLEATFKETEQVLINTKAQTRYRSKIIQQLTSFLAERNDETVFKNIRILKLELEHQNRKSKKAVALSQDRLKDTSIKFEDKLRKQFPDLTKSEREVCSLIRANKSIKEIAHVRDVSSPAIQSMRYRIRKKLGLQQGEDLPSFLQNL